MVGIMDSGESSGIASFRVFFKNGKKCNYSTKDLAVIHKILSSVAEIERWDMTK